MVAYGLVCSRVLELCMWANRFAHCKSSCAVFISAFQDFDTNSNGRHSIIFGWLGRLAPGAMGPGAQVTMGGALGSMGPRGPGPWDHRPKSPWAIWGVYSNPHWRLILSWDFDVQWQSYQVA